jgi:NADPH:quinone reductase-like Zn-dependent oxidoreductase
MRVVRLRAPGGPEQLAVEEADRPRPGPADALVRVHAAAITRGELEWPVDRLPAIPSYELSGVIEDVGANATGVAAGDEVFALTPFDRDGVAADYRDADGAMKANGIVVLAATATGVSHVVAFHADPALVGVFGFPDVLTD